MLYVSDMTLYSMRSGILSQWSFLRTGVMWWCFGEFSSCSSSSFVVNCTNRWLLIGLLAIRLYLT